MFGTPTHVADEGRRAAQLLRAAPERPHAFAVSEARAGAAPEAGFARTPTTRHAAAIVGQAAAGATREWLVTGTGGLISSSPTVIDAKLAGTTLRFLTAVAALGAGRVELTGGAPLRERPVGPLLDALRACGATLRGSGRRGNHAPSLVNRAEGRLGGRVRLDSSQSSQFVSALLLVAPYFDDHLVLEHHGAGARGYIDLTVELMSRHGA